MTDAVFVVRSHELAALIGSRGFLALPREEIGHYCGAIEVLSAERARAAQDPTLTQLVTYTVIHYNYAWFTYQRRDALDPPRSLGLVGSIEAAGRSLLFLDECTEADALRTLRGSVMTRDECDLRLAGVITGEAESGGAPLAGLVYVARLRQPGVDSCNPQIAGVAFSGKLELEHERAQFDRWSRALIDKLHAL